ncbi:sigma-70 family RNA polymerase sigma factor [Nocardioides sp. YIM 152588]|uniref:sigma-70 family RNA polymerase sigma factor n=1 Tax=Nocardioides sp. YIM 152588 TaxID=3158259 RepID=UPI0032E42766
MDEPAADADPRTERAWREHRRRVLDIGYRMLGTLADAEDALQETYARLVRHGAEGIDDVEGWLVTVAGRVCLDRLRADTVRARYVGPWLPEPLLELPGSEPDPADRVTLDDTVRIALLATLELLTPAERLAFVLHDVFGLPFEQVASIAGRTPAAARKLASRARATIREDPEPRFEVPDADARAVAEAFAAACATGDLAGLMALLDPEVVGEFDSGGRVAGAPQGPLVGAEVVAGVLVRTLAGAGASFATVPVNGQPGVVVSLHGRVMAVICLETDGERVAAIRAIGNPEKLARLDRVR